MRVTTSDLDAIFKDSESVTHRTTPDLFLISLSHETPLPEPTIITSKEVPTSLIDLMLSAHTVTKGTEALTGCHWGWVRHHQTLATAAVKNCLPAVTGHRLRDRGHTVQSLCPNEIWHWSDSRRWYDQLDQHVTVAYCTYCTSHFQGRVFKPVIWTQVMTLTFTSNVVGQNQDEVFWSGRTLSQSEDKICSIV